MFYTSTSWQGPEPQSLLSSACTGYTLVTQPIISEIQTVAYTSHSYKHSQEHHSKQRSWFPETLTSLGQRAQQIQWWKSTDVSGVRVEQTVVICIPEMHLFHVSLQSPAVLSEKRHEDGTGEYHSAWQQHFLLLNSSFDSGKLQLAHSVHPQQVIVMTE